MKNILTQDDWDRLPVNTYARLTTSGPEGYTDTYVTRVDRETGPAEGEDLSLGGQAWRDAFQKSDITYALYIPRPRRTPMTKPLKEFRERRLAVQAARGETGLTPDMPEKIWTFLLGRALQEVDSRRKTVAMLEERAAQLRPGRDRLADLLYCTGETDTHPLIHGTTETIQAVDLSGRHLGMTARSITYSDSGHFTKPGPEEEYPLKSVQHTVTGMIHVNWGFHLRPDTPVTLIIPPAVREA